MLNPRGSGVFALALQDVLLDKGGAATKQYVVSTHKAGKVYTQDGDTPGWTLCWWPFRLHRMFNLPIAIRRKRAHSRA